MLIKKKRCAGGGGAPLTVESGKTMPFEKRRSRYKETAENKAEAYRVYGEHLFSACDAVDARIFSKGGEAGVIAVTSAKDKFPSECVWIEYEVVR